MLYRFVLLAALLVSATPLAYAQNAGMSLTPPVIEEGADPGDTIASSITLQNLSDTEERYFLFVRDIEGVTDIGRPIYATDDFIASEINLSRWVTLTQTAVDVAPGERVTVPFIITVPDNAPPGGHFAGIFGSLEPPEANVFGVGAGVGYRVGNIINLRVSGDINEEATIRSLQTDSFVYGDTNVAFTARIENVGNVLVRPVGPLTITNMLGDTVAEITMNESRAGVFPQSIRPLTTEWQGDGLGFGRYQAELSLAYGIPGEARYTIAANTSFWVLPWEIIRPLLITLAVLSLVSYVLIRYYINQQVRKLAGGRRLVRSTQVNGPSPLILAAIVMLFVAALILFILLAVFA